MSAMAEAKQDVIHADELPDLLAASGVRLIVRELELAPETMVEWGHLEPVDGSFRFVVPLLRRWIVRNRPLRRVKEELDRVDPLAETLYRAGQAFYTMQRVDEAQSQLRQALRINPNHLKAHLLLGRILLEAGETSEAVQVLEEAYAYDERAARADLVRALLARAEGEPEADQRQTYERVLHIDARQVVALERVEHLRRLQREREIAEETAEITRLLKEEEWAAAAAGATDLGTRYPDSDWASLLEQAQSRRALDDQYREAIACVEQGEKERGQRLLADVIARQPDYKESARFLMLATRGVDIEVLTRQVATLERTRHPLQDKAQREALIRRAESALRQHFPNGATPQDWPSVITELLSALESRAARPRRPRDTVAASPPPPKPATPREVIKALARSQPDSGLLKCPYCSQDVKPVHLVQHYDKVHAKES